MYAFLLFAGLFSWPDVDSLYYPFLVATAGRGTLYELKAIWRSPFLACLLLLTAGISAPQPSSERSLTSPPAKHKIPSEFGAQQAPPLATVSGAGHLSEPYRNVSCTPPVRFTRHQVWAYGFLAQFMNEGFNPDIMVCDMQGQQVNSAHIAIPGLSVNLLIAAVPSMDGDAIVSGHANTNPGLTFFLAKTSSSGGVVSVIRTENFMARGICEADDHTIWTLGRDQEKDKAHDNSYPLVEQFSFESGLLHGYLSKADSGVSNAGLLGASGASKFGGFLVCRNRHISLYLNETNEYIEIDPSTKTLKRWKMDAKPLSGGMAAGLAVTEKGRVYVSLFEDRHTETDWKFRRGLFEVRLDPNSGLGKWSLVSGTFSSSDPENIPDGIFFKLWGADGEDLVIRRLHEADMSWVRVIP